MYPKLLEAICKSCLLPRTGKEIIDRMCKDCGYCYNCKDLNPKEDLTHGDTEEFNRFSGSEAEEEHKEIWKTINHMYGQISRQKKQMKVVSEVLVDHKYHIEALQRKSEIPQKNNAIQTKDQ
ncbi:24485_t:CDS:2 [Racocetra persica]|uniref:24485_t:CDS:1 n=1 Tax=Racocetra persica TaxID=160502 RepID=A0ACA9KEZ3_9GLOM|nr:24485_t:CDS:2 [Racocetra persica]